MKEDRQTSMELGENLDEVQKCGNVSFRRRNFYRMLKIAVFILCLTGFGVQTFEFLDTFYTYPTVLNIKSERLQQFPTPALTICSKYMLNVTKYCEEYEDKCSRNNITNTVTPKIFPGYKEFLINKDFLYDAYFVTEEVIDIYGIENSKETFGKKFIFYDSINTSYHACYGYGYGLKDGYLRNMTVRDYERNKKWADFSLSFEHAVNVPFDPPPYGTLYIHSPFLSFKTYEKKITVKPFNRYLIRASLQEERLLPSPYDTNCTDYVSLWHENGGTGPLSREMCQYDCSRGSSYFEQDDTVFPAFYCADAIDGENREKYTSVWKMCKCYVECKEDCLVLKYDYTYQEAVSIYPEAYIYISMEDNKVQISTYNPQYMDVELFSYVGGFLGCWLGISIWSLNGILWRAYYCAVARAKRWTTALGRRPPPPPEGASQPEAHHKTKETP